MTHNQKWFRKTHILSNVEKKIEWKYVMAWKFKKRPSCLKFKEEEDGTVCEHWTVQIEPAQCLDSRLNQEESTHTWRVQEETHCWVNPAKNKSFISWFQSTNNQHALELRFSQFWIVMTMYIYLWIQNQGQVQNWEVLQYCCAFPSLLRRWGPKSRSWWARKWLGTRQRSPCCAVWVPASLWGSLLCPTDPAFNSPSLKLKKEKNELSDMFEIYLFQILHIWGCTLPREDIFS